MKLRTIVLPVIALSALSACGSRDKDAEGTSVSINAKEKDGNVAINADGKTGKVSVNLPGFNADLKLPKMMLDHSNFDLDGVKLYPESKVRSVVVNADDTGGHDTDDGDAFVVTLTPNGAAATSGTIDIDG